MYMHMGRDCATAEMERQRQRKRRTERGRSKGLTGAANDADGDREAGEGLVDDTLYARPAAEVKPGRGEDDGVVLGR